VNEYKLFSPEKVYLNINLAGVGSRFAACFIDGIFQGLLMALIIFSLALFAESSHIAAPKLDVKTTGLLGLAVISVIIFVISNGYFIFFETIWNGQTPGKRFIKIRVVQENGSSVTFLMVLIRNLLRIIDSLPFGYAVGIIAWLFSKRNQRLGDMAAGTIVIRESNETVPEVVDFEVVETPWAGVARLHIHEIGEDDFAVLKKYLLRRQNLKVSEAQDLEQNLAHFFSQKLGLCFEEIGTPAEFLKQVAAMYQQR